MIFVGIDPGLSGGLARLGYTDWVDPQLAVAGAGPGYRVWDAPIMRDGKHNVLLPVEMKRILVEAVSGQECIVFIEKVHSMPKQGIVSAFNFGEGYGIWQGLVAGLGLPFEKVTPQRWQKEMLAGMQGGKEASIIRAQELFPQADLSLRKHHGRADALLICEFARRTYGGGA